MPDLDLDLAAVGDVKRIMRATNTAVADAAAAAVTSIDEARVDGDWRVTGKKGEGGAKGSEGGQGERREEKSSKVVLPFRRWKRKRKREGVLRGKWTMLGETRVSHPRGRDRPLLGHTFCVVGHPPGGTERERGGVSGNPGGGEAGRRRTDRQSDKVGRL